MNTDSSTAEKPDTETSSCKHKSVFLIRWVCLLLMLSCMLTAAALCLLFFHNFVAAAVVGLLCAGVIIFSILVMMEFCKTEQYMKLYLEGNGNDPLRLIRFHYSKAAEQLLAERQSIIPQNVRQEENRRKAQYLALQNQINPHFLYNTLEAIRSEAVIGGLDTIADMSETLANFFRYTISNTSGLVTLADEIKNVQDYFTIQRFRFGERIDLQIQIPMEGPLQFYRLPKLILQPIVENAIIHGLEDRIQGGRITISARTTENKVFIVIEDNGKGMDYHKLIDINHHLSLQIRSDVHTGKHSGIAIFNVNDRLRLLYGQNYGLTYYSMPQVGTAVEIVLPNMPGGDL